MSVFKYPPEVKQRAMSMLAQGHSVRSIADQLGVSAGLISQWKNGERKGHDIIPYQYNDEQVSEFAEMYAQGLSMRVISDKTGVPRQHLITLRQHDSRFKDAYETALSDDDTRLQSLSTRAQERILNAIIDGLDSGELKVNQLQQSLYAINKINESYRERIAPAQTVPSFEATVKVTGISKDDILGMINKSAPKQIKSQPITDRDIQDIIDADINDTTNNT